jgi:glucose uptake protein
VFPKVLGQAIGGDNALAPYSAMMLLSIATLLSAPFFVLFFITFPVVSTGGGPSGYLSGSGKQHVLGLGGGVLYGAGVLTGLLAAVAQQDAQPSALIQYVLSNGALVVAAAWGLLAWREFREGGHSVRMLAVGMMVLFLAGLGLVAYAISPQ